MTVPHIRRSAALRACVGVTALAGAAACTPPGGVSPRPVTILPGSAVLAPPGFEAGAVDIPVYRGRPAGDTSEVPLSRVTRTESVVPDDAARALLSSVWAPPYTSRDSLVIERATLRPVAELLVNQGVTYRFQYAGARVTGTVQHADSVAQAFHRTYEQPVFAFNEVEPLARSLEYRTGLTLVVPLFSEIDRDVEHDTLSVVGPGPSSDGVAAWVVRFADPVITTLYLVEARTRRIVDAVTTQRRSGVRIHYRYAEATLRTAGAGD